MKILKSVECLKDLVLYILQKMKESDLLLSYKEDITKKIDEEALDIRRTALIIKLMPRTNGT